MKKKNKIIAVVIAVAIVVSIFVTATFANAKSSSVSIEVSKETLFSGETAVVTVKVSANYPVATFSIPVFYDKTKVQVSDAAAVMPNYAQADVATDATAVDSAKIYNQTAVDSTKYGFVLVNYIGGANETVPATLENEIVLTFTITAKADVSGNAAVMCVSESAKTDSNTAGMLYFGSTTSGTTITSIPENVENVNVTNAAASVTISNGSTELVAKGGTDTVVDTNNKYIYGIKPGSNIEDCFQVNNGSYELVPTSSGATNGTGAQIKVKDAGGTVVDTYTVIIFGDVNGDGVVTMADSSEVELASLGKVITKDFGKMAADVNGDGGVTMSDANEVELASLGKAITTNPYA